VTLWRSRLQCLSGWSFERRNETHPCRLPPSLRWTVRSRVADLSGTTARWITHLGAAASLSPCAIAGCSVGTVTLRKPAIAHPPVTGSRSSRRIAVLTDSSRRKSGRGIGSISSRRGLILRGHQIGGRRHMPHWRQPVCSEFMRLSRLPWALARPWSFWRSRVSLATSPVCIVPVDVA
jgi:hypothetical protein